MKVAGWMVKQINGMGKNILGLPKKVEKKENLRYVISIKLHNLLYIPKSQSYFLKKL